METIVYQGQSIEAEVVNQMGGELRVAHLPNDYQVTHQGNERLFRDPEGCYYLERRLQLWDVHGTGQRHTSDRVRIHRLSLKAAILWATVRFGSETADLRHDARDVLAGPAALNPTSRFSDGSMVISVHLKPQVASLVRAVAEAEDETPLGITYTSLEQYVIGALVQGGGRTRERELEKLFSAHAPEEYEPAKPAVLRLLNSAGAIHAEAEIGRDLLGKLKQQAEHNRDDWQRTLTDLLGDGLRMAREWVGIVELDAVAETLVRRYHREEYGEARYEGVMPGDVVNGVLVNWLEAILEIHEDRTDGDAIVEARNRRRHGLSDEDEKSIEAAETEKAVEEDGGLVLRLIYQDDPAVDEIDLPADLSARLQEDAKERGLSLEETVRAIVRETVTKSEEEGAVEVLASTGFDLEPKAAKLLARYRKLRPYENAHDIVNAAFINWMDAAMEGAKRDAPDGWDVDVAAARRRRVRREGQSQQPVAITAGAVDAEGGGMVVTVRFKPEPARLLRAVCVKLECDAEQVLFDGARMYVCSDLAVSPQEDRDFDRIFRNNPPGGGDAVPATNRVRYPATQKEYNQALTRLERQLGLPEVPGLHGINAAAPEAISEEEVATARQSDAVPMRDVLVDLAAGWRIEGAEKGGQIANVLDKCADALEAALEGKEVL